MTTVNGTPMALPGKENAVEPPLHSSSASGGKKKQQVREILKPRSQDKNTPSSSNSGKGGLVVKPGPIVLPRETPYSSSNVAAVIDNTKDVSGVAASHQVVDNNEHDAEGATTMIDWKAESKELDEMFDNQNRDKFRDLPKIAKPRQLLAELFPHQTEGISWMVNQECKSEEEAIPPFYILKSNGKYRCTLTCNRTQDKPPAPVRGGILADDMGLGKTMQTIGLILANPPPKSRQLKAKTGPRCTLIVSPLMPMSHWKNEIAKVVKKNFLKVATFHGANRQLALAKVQSGSVDVLLTTYETLASHFQSYKKTLANEAEAMNNDPEEELDERDPFLFELEFYRVVLDEAQQIRNKNTKSFKAVMAVDAEKRWCLTGTPMVNKPDDIQPYFEFLGFEPFSDYHIYERYVTDLIKAKKGVGLRRLRTAVSFCTLRRSKDQVKSDTELPPKIVFQQTVPFGDNVHASTYETLYGTARSLFSKQLNQEDGSRSLKDVWPLLIRLKQACCHAELVPEFVRERAALAYEIRDESDDPSSILAIMKATDESDDKSGDQKNNARKLSDDVDPHSPKVVALMKSITEMKPDEKGVIFSQFTSFLDVLEKALTAGNHTFTRIDGAVDSQKRQIAMQKFSTDACDSPETPRFILCSLKACGVGINLTRANHVFMMDPWWNTSMEAQSYDRVYRIGQTREVRVVRFVMKDSIEERLVAVQDAKQALGNGSLQKLTKAEQEKAKLTTIRDLFELEEEADDDGWDWLVDDSDEDY